jgi:hypothetical protein
MVVSVGGRGWRRTARRAFLAALFSSGNSRDEPEIGLAPDFQASWRNPLGLGGHSAKSGQASFLEIRRSEFPEMNRPLPLGAQPS